MKAFGKDLLAKIKEAPLAGEEAHRVYSPPYRPVLPYEEILKKKPRFAAVNILLYLKEDVWYFPLMLRTENERDKHSGQISLPGGSRDPQDTGLQQTAVRETWEEIGIEPAYIKIVRELSPLYIPPSNFYVTPFVSFTRKNPAFYLQESEALELIEFPVDDLINLSTSPDSRAFPTSRGTQVPFIDFQGHLIWGATSMILSEFSHLLKNL